MDTIDDVNSLFQIMRKTLRELRYKCRRHNADYYTDSAIPDRPAGYRPKPDHTERIMTEWLPEWMPGLLKEYVKPTSQIALPNFVVEFKGDTSMEIAHQQARLDCGIVAQAFKALYSLYGYSNCLG
jgi:hypothetical protein